MCASCGCGKVDDQMGDDRHLVMTDLKDAAEAAGISVQEVGKNLQAAAGQKGQQASGNAQGHQGAAQGQAAQKQDQQPNGNAQGPNGNAQGQPQQDQVKEGNKEAQQAANRSQEETKERVEQPQGNR